MPSVTQQTYRLESEEKYQQINANIWKLSDQVSSNQHVIFDIQFIYHKLNQIKLYFHNLAVASYLSNKSCCSFRYS